MVNVFTGCTVSMLPPLCLSRVHAQPQTRKSTYREGGTVQKLLCEWDLTCNAMCWRGSCHVLEGFVKRAAIGCTRPVAPDSPNTRRQDELEGKRATNRRTSARADKSTSKTRTDETS